MKNKLFAVALTLLIAVIFSSCISVERFVKLNPDGTGEEEMKMIFQREFYSMVGSFAMMFDSTGTESGMMDSLYDATAGIEKLKEQFNSTEGVTLIDCYSQIQPDSSNLVFVKYAFNDVQRIGESMNKVNEDFEESPSKVTLTRENDGLVFRYSYENTDTSLSYMGDSASSEMISGLAGLFVGGKFKLELDAPFDIQSTNATSQDGRRLVWDYPLSKLISEKKFVLEAVMKE